MVGTASYTFDRDVVVVTGGARGQGLSHALAFARCGARTIIIDCSTASRPEIAYPLSQTGELDSARGRLSMLSDEHLVLDLDITDEEAQAEAASEIGARFGKI